MRAARGRLSPATTTLDGEIADSESSIGALSARLDTALAARSDLPRRLAEYLRSLPSGIRIEELPAAPMPKLGKNESLTEVVEAARTKLGGRRRRA
jgi:hypothetical protein